MYSYLPILLNCTRVDPMVVEGADALCLINDNEKTVNIFRDMKPMVSDLIACHWDVIDRYAKTVVKREIISHVDRKYIHVRYTFDDGSAVSKALDGQLMIAPYMVGTPKFRNSETM